MSAEVENILRSFWEWRLKESPEFATQIGVHTHDNNLDGHSLGAYARRQVPCSILLTLHTMVCSLTHPILTEVIEPQLEKGLVGTRRTSVQCISEDNARCSIKQIVRKRNSFASSESSKGTVSF